MQRPTTTNTTTTTPTDDTIALAQELVAAVTTQPDYFAALVERVADPGLKINFVAWGMAHGFVSRYNED